MRVPRVVLKLLRKYLLSIPQRRPPDEMIGPGCRVRLRNYRGREHEMPTPPKMFLRRWFLIPKNKISNIYLHEFCADDEDRALHDHPWINLSCLLANRYIEHTIEAGGVHKRRIYEAGELKFRMPWSAHRVELTRDAIKGDAQYLHINDMGKVSSWSLFITGWTMSHWGFHCPGEWVTNETFAENKGCGPQDYRALEEYRRD